MMLMPLFALALAAQAPATPTAAPSATAETQAAAPAPTEADLEIASNAPKDDYGLVAWCQGAVQGHLELYKASEPLLLAAAKKRGDKNLADTARLDEALMRDERGFLDQFARALAAADKASVSNLQDRAVEAKAQGQRIWSAIRQADDKTKVLMVPYWGVPSRCLTTSQRLETRSLLFAQALQQNNPASTAADPGASTAAASSDLPPPK